MNCDKFIIECKLISRFAIDVAENLREEYLEYEQQ